MTGWRELKRNWRTLTASTLGIGCGVSSLIFYSLGAFIKPLNAAFGWSRAEVAVVSIIAPLTIAAVTPWVGRLADRVAARVLVVASLLALSMSLFLLSYCPDDLRLFYAGFFLAALLGAASTPLVFTKAINERFSQARGKALGISLCGTGIAAALLPQFLIPVIERAGWQSGFVVLAVIAASAIIPVWFFLAREPAINSTKATSDVPRSMSGHAPAYITFLMMAVFFFAAIAASAIIVHLPAMVSDLGAGAETGARIVGLVGIAVIAGRLIAGALVDRWFAPRVAFAFFLIGSAGVACLLTADLRLLPIAAIAVGLAIGSEVDLVGYLVARYFGRRDYGLHFGRQYSAFLVGSALGPVGAGLIFDASGNYRLAILLAALSLLFAAVGCLRLPKFAAELH